MVETHGHLQDVVQCHIKFEIDKGIHGHVIDVRNKCTLKLGNATTERLASPFHINISKTPVDYKTA